MLRNNDTKTTNSNVRSILKFANKYKKDLLDATIKKNGYAALVARATIAPICMRNTILFQAYHRFR